MKWINNEGCPREISAEPGIFNNNMTEAMESFQITIEPRPARRHKKLGIVERKNGIIRCLSQWLFEDAEFFINSRRTKVGNVDINDVLSRATNINNNLYGNKILSSFEMVGGYTQAIQGLLKSPVSEPL